MWSQLLQTELHAEACPKDESCYLNAGSFYTEQEGTIRNTWIHFKTLLDPITIKWTYKKNRNRASCHFTPHSFLDSHSSWAHLGFTFPASKKRHLEICLLHCGSSRGWGGGVLAAWLFMVSLLPLSTSLVLIPELLPSAACCVNWGGLVPRGQNGLVTFAVLSTCHSDAAFYKPLGYAKSTLWGTGRGIPSTPAELVGILYW